MGTGKLTFVCNRCGRTEFKNGHALGGHKKYCLKKQYEHSDRNRLAMGLTPLPTPELKVRKKTKKPATKRKPASQKEFKRSSGGRSLLKRRRDESKVGESKSSFGDFSDDSIRIPEIDLGSSIEWRNVSSQGFINPSPSPRDFD